MLGVNIFWFVVLLMVLVLVHEWGHMVVAKKTGMRVERFSIFFGRPLARFTRGETEYGIGWLPLGGYVKISGMTPGEDIPPEHEHRAYYKQAVWKRIATIFAGPGVNILLAFVLFAITFWIGVPVGGTNEVAAVRDGSAAAAAGLQAGDRLLAVDGRGDGDPAQLQRELRSSIPGAPVTVTYERDGNEISRTVPIGVLEGPDGRPLVNADGLPVPGLGFSFGGTERSGPIEGLVEGADLTWFVVTESVRNLGEALFDSEAREQVSSVVGIGATFNEIADDGIIVVLRFAALISLALGIFNLIPLLPLDGGHIAVALIEKASRGSVPRSVIERASFVGLALILLVFFVAVQNDISNLTGG